jgi:diaminopimelate decarboxylase
MPVVRNRKKEVLADVVGPLCESGDFLGKGRKLPGPGKGDLLAVMSAGAYGFTMSSNYNSRRRVAEVMVRGKKHALVKARETLRDLVKGEHIPGFLR